MTKKPDQIAQDVLERFLITPLSLNEIMAEMVKSGELDKKYVRLVASKVNHMLYVDALKKNRSMEFQPAKADEIIKMAEEMESKQAEDDGEVFTPKSLEFQKKLEEEEREAKIKEIIKTASEETLAKLQIEFEKHDFHRLPIYATAFRQILYEKYGEQGVRRLKGYLQEIGYSKEAEAIFPNIDPSDKDWWISQDHIKEAEELARDFQKAWELEEKIKALKKTIME